MSHRGALQCLNSSPVAYHSHTLTPSSTQSSMAKMAPQRTSSADSAEAIRKRVCKACDRCRLKKSKCDGSNPCTRCKTDNAICYFGERKKSHDRVYPKGYVEMLEQQQAQLVSGLQMMYRKLVAAGQWTGSELPEPNGNPLTHDMLAALDLLETRGDGEPDVFEDDLNRLQPRLVSQGAGFSNRHARRGSISSESEHSQHSHARTTSNGTPVLTKPGLFKDNFGFDNASQVKDNYAFDSTPSSSTQSPVPRQPAFFPLSQPAPTNPVFAHDPQLFQAQWAYPEQDNDVKYLMRSDFAIQTPDLDQTMAGVPYSAHWDSPSTQYDLPTQTLSYNQLSSSTFGYQDPAAQMEMDISQFIQAQAVV